MKDIVKDLQLDRFVREGKHQGDSEDFTEELAGWGYDLLRQEERDPTIYMSHHPNSSL